MGIPKDLTSKFFPNLGDQHVVGLANVGVHAVEVTLSVNTSQTDAQIIASPPNTASPAVPTNVVVHSHGTPPTSVIAMLSKAPLGNNGAAIGWDVGIQYITMDNSAVYLRANTWTGTAPAGVAARLTVIR